LGGMTAGAGTSAVNVDNGTMTVTGATGFAVDNLRVGFADNIVSAIGNLTVTGGPVAVGSGTTHNIHIGRRTVNNTNSSSGTVDCSGASRVTFNVANLRLGQMTAGTAGGTQSGLLRMSAAGTNTITADDSRIGEAATGADNSSVTSEIVFGAGLNDINITT